LANVAKRESLEVSRRAEPMTTLTSEQFSVAFEAAIEPGKMARKARKMRNIERVEK
jgi:hypothetical protein